MMMRKAVELSHLVDTNILLRRQQRDHVQALIAVQALYRLRQQGEELSVARQNLVEFRNTASRPFDKNGIGLTPTDADFEIDILERGFTTLPDDDRVYEIWRQLIAAKGVSGKQVHDARLVAFMLVYGVTHILTFNGADFRRFETLPPNLGNGIVVVHPSAL